MSTKVDSLKFSSHHKPIVSRINTDSTNIQLFSSDTLTTKNNNNDLYIGLGVTAATLLTYFLSKGKIKKALKARQTRLDNELINQIYGFNQSAGRKDISKLFRDSTTKACDVAIKEHKEIDPFMHSLKSKLPSKYITTNANGQQIIKNCVELELFEMHTKGKGLGTKKIQEIIKYAKKHTDGRFYLMAQQKQGFPSPVLFYYKNGLRSFDDSTNVLLEKILKGEESMSKLPNLLGMYLP